MAKSRPPLSAFDLTGIANDFIEGEAAREKQQEEVVQKKKYVETKPIPARVEKRSARKKASAETRLISKKPTGVYLYEDQLDTLREMEYRKRQRHLTSETIRTALDEYFKLHGVS